MARPVGKRKRKEGPALTSVRAPDLEVAHANACANSSHYHSHSPTPRATGTQTCTFVCGRSKCRQCTFSVVRQRPNKGPFTWQELRVTMCKHGEMAPLINKLQQECDEARRTRYKKPNWSAAQIKELQDGFAKAEANGIIQSAKSVSLPSLSDPLPKVTPPARTYVHLRSHLQRHQSRGFVFPQNTAYDLGMEPGADNQELILTLLPLKIKLAKMHEDPDAACEYAKHFQYTAGKGQARQTWYRSATHRPMMRTTRKKRRPRNMNRPRPKRRMVMAMTLKKNACEEI